MEQFKYEESVAQLEKIVRQLESSELTLEQMLKLYEQGTKLAAECAKALDAAEFKITNLTAKGAEEE